MSERHLSDPFVIDDESHPFKPLYSSTVYGFRPFPISNITTRDWKDGLVIDAEVLAKAVRAIAPGEAVTLAQLDTPRTLPMTGTNQSSLVIESSYEEQNNLRIQKYPAPPAGVYDPEFIISAFGTELVDQGFIAQASNVPVDRIGTIRLNQAVGMDFLTAYAGLNSLRNFEPNMVPASFNQLDNALAQHADLYAVAKISIGDVDMGEPLIFEPSALGATVPNEWNEAYNVKLVIFGISVRTICMESRE